MTEKDAFRTLGLDEYADAQDVKAAYRILSRKYHPDSAVAKPEVKAFDAVVTAYRLLSEKLAPSAGQEPSPGPKAHGAGDIFVSGRILLSGAPAESRIAAARALSLSGKRSAWMFLREALRDRDERVAMAAVRAVAMLSIRQADDDMALLYAAKDREFREGLIMTAETLVDPVFGKMLESASFGTDCSAVRGSKMDARGESCHGQEKDR